MPRPEVQQEHESRRTLDGDLSVGAGSSGSSSSQGPAMFWLASCVMHLLLFVAVGLLLRDSADVLFMPPIKVSVIGSGEPVSLLDDVSLLPQSRPPERQLRPPDLTAQATPSQPDPVLMDSATPLPPPLVPDRSTPPPTPAAATPTVIGVAPDIKSMLEPPPVMQPPRAAPVDRPLPEVASPTPPLAPPPPIVTQAPAPRVPQTSPRREVPNQRRPSTTFDDAVVARVPSAEVQRPSPPLASPPAPRAVESASPPPRPTRVAHARYGQNPPPAYPSEARRRGWEGTVLLVVEILETGRPERVTIKQSSGHPVLDKAALGAVSRWTFIPAQHDGRPTRSLAEIPIVFSLRNGR